LSARDPALLDSEWSQHYLSVIVMTNIFTAAIGILIYFLSGKVPHLRLLLFFIAGLGLVSFISAWTIGASNPKWAARLYQTSVLLTLTLGGVAAALVIWATAWILTRKGTNPTPYVEAISSAAIALVGLISVRFEAKQVLSPSALAKRGTYWRYHWRFPQLYGHDPKERLQAYEAIHNDPISDEQGAIKGWGLKSTRRRLRLIAKAL
jgi:hypothetical protein